MFLPSKQSFDTPAQPIKTYFTEFYCIGAKVCRSEKALLSLSKQSFANGARITIGILRIRERPIACPRANPARTVTEPAGCPG